MHDGFGVVHTFRSENAKMLQLIRDTRVSVAIEYFNKIENNGLKVTLDFSNTATRYSTLNCSVLKLIITFSVMFFGAFYA